MTTIGVLTETAPGERRVALVPGDVTAPARGGPAVLVESGAGAAAWYDDDTYTAAGAQIGTRAQVYEHSDILLCVNPPDDIGAAHSGQLLAGMLAPRRDPGLADRLAATGITALSLDLLPRTLSRAQAMDPLTSQASVAGYKAALVAADAYGGYLPMLTTAAGTVRPAAVLVLGAGIAGLQAIATCRRLGARVSGYDVRPAALADIASTGASVLAVPALTATGTGGYARPLTADEAGAQRHALDDAVAGFDIVITSAQVPYGKPPLLLTARAVGTLRPGSVVVDVAAGEQGGNVEGSVPGGTLVTPRGVTVIGAGNLAAQVPRAASDAYSRNLRALLASLLRDTGPALDPDDGIHAAIVVTRDGAVLYRGPVAAAVPEVTS